MIIVVNVLKNGISGLKKNKIFSHEGHEEDQKIYHWGHREHGKKIF